MKSINILSLAQANSSLEVECLASYLNYYGIEINNSELADLTTLVDALLNATDDKNIFNQFYVGYKIPQIGKEFDLLKFGHNYVLNVELKRISTEEKIFKQLKRNKYYLSFLGKKVYQITFVSETSKFYFLNEDNEISEVDISCLVWYLKNIENDDVDDLDILFDPSDYLVSPFNSTQQFIGDEYFLTKQQEEIKTNVSKIVEDVTSARFVSITGNPGTGKTLLVYDLAKEMLKKQISLLIVHCGYLNNGHQVLNAQHGWNIIPIKHLHNYDLSEHDIVIIDEAQRIYPNQLENVIENIEDTKGMCIFSYDSQQTLATWEEARNIPQKISGIDGIVSYALSKKIRTNKEIASFIVALFDRNKKVTLQSNGNIKLNYFCNIVDAKFFIENLKDQGYEVLRFTPSQYNNEYHERYSSPVNETSHGIIGQEFDGVVVTIDNFFFYDDTGKLSYRGKSYYDPVRMLFQNITRTRKRLNVVIINNGELLGRCLSLL